MVDSCTYKVCYIIMCSYSEVGTWITDSANDMNSVNSAKWELCLRPSHITRVGKLQCWVRYCSGRIAKYSAVRHVPRKNLAACLLFLFALSFKVSFPSEHLTFTLAFAFMSSLWQRRKTLKQRSRPHLPKIEFILAEFNFVVSSFFSQAGTVTAEAITNTQKQHVVQGIIII